MAHISGNPTWLNRGAGSTPINATTLEALENTLDGTNRMNEFRPGKLITAKVENVGVPANTEQTLLNVTGPGVVESLWITPGGGAAPDLDGRLRVYYDGSGTPDFDIDFGTLLAAHFGAGGSGGTHYTPHMTLNINSVTFNLNTLITFPMPFGTSIKIAYFNKTGSATSATYSIAAYRLTPTDMWAGMRLHCSGIRFADQVATRLSSADTTFASVSGGPGWVVWHSYVGGVGTATNLSWMERNPTFTIDGEGSPSIVATGTEDWFDCAWYFNTWRDFMPSTFSYVGQDAGAASPNQFVVGMATDFLAKWGGIPFNSSFVYTAPHETACTTGDQFVYAVLYYM